MTDPSLPDAGDDLTDRPTRLLMRWIALLSRHRLVLTVVLLLGGVLFSALSSRIRWQPDILLFFSADSADVKSVRRISDERGIANHLRLDVHAREKASADPADLRAAARSLGAKLRGTGLFREVWEGTSQQQIITSYASTMAQGPLLLDEAALQELKERLTPQYLERRFTSVAGRLTDPDGEIALRQLQADPLDISGLIGDRVRAAAPAGAGEATLLDGMLVSGDGRHIMLILEPNCLPSNQQEAQTAIAAIDAAVREVSSAHPFLEVWTVGAHRAYVENARRVVRDVTWVSLLGSLAVGLAVGLYFRRWTCVLICLLPPSVGTGVVLGLYGMGRAELPLIVLGFGGLLCGSTTDYGIQLISACRRRVEALGGWRDDVPARAVREMIGPISMSVATSVTAFAALGLSNAAGLRSLGLFVAAATVCIWVVTFLVLPAYLGPWVIGKSTAPLPWSISPRQWRFLRAAAVLAFAGATLWLGWHALHVRFNADPRALDGSSQALRREEEAFYRVWGDLRHRAVVLLREADAEALLKSLHEVELTLADQHADGMIQSVHSAAALLPDRDTLRERADAWAALWTAEQRSRAQSLVQSAAAQAGFRPAAWQAWLDRLGRAPEAAPAAQRLRDCPLALFPGLISSDGSTIAVIVQMRPDVSLRMATAWAGELRLRFPGITIISGDLLIFDATERARAEAENLGPLAILAIILPLWVYFRRITLAVVVSASLIVGFIWVLGSAQVFAGGLNLLCLVPILFTLGVAIDYGIYVASAAAGGARQAGDKRLGATLLCAVTTILGTGSLALAYHPVLRWLGITLVAGVLGGYLTSALVIAPLAAWLRRPARSGWYFVPFRLIGRGALVGMVLLLAVPPWTQWVLHRQKPANVQAAADVPSVRSGRHEWRSGDSWMRRRDGIWEIFIGGSPEQIGHDVTKLGGPISLRIENEMMDQLDALLPQVWSRWLVLRAMSANLTSLQKHTPLPIQREIHAMATAYADPHAYLAPTYPRLLGYHALHDVSQMLIDNPLIVSQAGACTGVVALPAFSGDGHLWTARNFDFEAGRTFGLHKSIVYCRPDDGIPFASVAWPGLSGCVTGMNKARLAVFINAAATRDFRRIGTPTIFMVRQILQHASSIAQAIAIVRATEVFVSDIVIIADGKTGQAVIIEKSPADTAVRGVDGLAVIANHLVSPRFKDDPVNLDRMAAGTTLPRHERAAELLGRLRGKVDQQGLADLLRDKRGAGDKDIGLGNRNAIDGLIACHSVIMDVTAGRMWVAAWPNAEGVFVHADVMAMLDDHPEARPPDRAMNLPPDPIMVNGRWDDFRHATAALVRASAALTHGDASMAEAHAREAIAANPSFYQGHELLGRALLKRGDKVAARDSLRKALALDPPYAARRAAIEEAIQACQSTR